LFELSRRFLLRWRAEALRLREPLLPDVEAEINACASEGDAESRLLAWAKIAGGRAEWVAALSSWRQRGLLLLALFTALAFVGGFATALSVLGDGSRSVNILWAVGALLGLHLIMLMLWCVGMVLSSDGAVLGRLMLWLTTRLEKGYSASLTQAWVLLSNRAGVTQWWFGLLSHLVWLAALGGAVVGLLLAFALRSYVFVWETTILTPEIFGEVVRILSLLPASLGVLVPDPASIADVRGVQVDDARRGWAGWLTAIVVIYGLLPRLLMAAVSVFVVMRSLQDVRLQLSDPFWTTLLARLSPGSEAGKVTDPAPEPDGAGRVLPFTGPASGLPVLIRFELPDNLDGLAEHNLLNAQRPEIRAFNVNSRAERQHLHSALMEQPAVRMLVVCDSRQTPDRGTLAWLVSAGNRAAGLRVWLLASAASSQERMDSWRAGLTDIGGQDLLMTGSLAEALNWLEAGA
jgi:hypothetical protein